MSRTRLPAVPAAALLLLAAPSFAQQGPIKTVHVAGNVHMLIGQGGNIGVCIGEDGTFLVDDQFAPVVDQIKAAVKKLSDKPVQFVVNTHWHGDHTGGNERFGKGGAVLVAHANVRKRLSTEQFMKLFDRKVPPSPKAALPVVTFTKSVTFHWNGEEIHVFHVAGAHTDGDAIIHFKKANVFHMGDTFFNGMYPFIDTGSGGGIHGMIAAVDRVLAMADAETKIIPGHGPLTDRKGLKTYRGMLAAVRDRVLELIKSGKSSDEVVAARPTKSLDGNWGGGFMKPDVFTRLVDESLRRSAGDK